MSTGYKYRKKEIQRTQRRLKSKRLTPNEMPHRPPLGWITFPCPNCGEPTLSGHFVQPCFGDHGMWACGGVLTIAASKVQS